MDEVQTDMNQYNTAIEKHIREVNVQFWEEHQKNFSEEAMEIYNRSLNGEKLTELDHFIMVTENQQQIEEYKKFYYIKEDIKNNNLSQEGLNFLVDTLCGEDIQSADVMKQKFSGFVKQDGLQK